MTLGTLESFQQANNLVRYSFLKGTSGAAWGTYWRGRQEAGGEPREEQLQLGGHEHMGTELRLGQEGQGSERHVHCRGNLGVGSRGQGNWLGVGEVERRVWENA